MLISNNGKFIARPGYKLVPCERCKTWQNTWPHCEGLEEVPMTKSEIKNATCSAPTRFINGIPVSSEMFEDEVRWNEVVALIEASYRDK